MSIAQNPGWINEDFMKYRDTSASKLHKMSGCVPSCNLMHYTLTPNPGNPEHHEYSDDSKYMTLLWNSLDISVNIPVSEYKIYQQVSPL